MKQIIVDSQGLPGKFYFNEKTKDTIFVVTENIEYIYKGKKYVIPSGFDSDGASIPKFAWRLIGHPFDMRYLLHAIFHDWLYRCQVLSRNESDLALFYGPKDTCGLFRRCCIYIALKLFGWVAWNKHKKVLNMTKKQENK